MSPPHYTLKAKVLTAVCRAASPTVSRRSPAIRCSFAGEWIWGLWLLAGLILVAHGAESPKPGTAERSSVVSSTAPRTRAVGTNSLQALDNRHRLAIGDKLSFRILEDEDDPKESLEPKSLIVTDSGDVEVPYLGRIPAENKTCQQLAREIKTALEKDYYYQATVILAVDVMAKSRGKVYLVGPVHLPGPQEIPSDEVLTLSKAIMRAGGFEEFADKRNVRVTRKGGSNQADKKTFVVDVGEIFDKGKVDRDPVLEPGDLILVPERLVRF